MWYANRWLLPMLEVYQSHPAIKEILIINNRNAYDLELLKEFDKVRVLGNGENMYVNPAWNLGVAEAKEERILIINDDIIISEFKLVMWLLENKLKPGMIIGFHKDSFSKLKVEKLELLKPPAKYIPHGFGVFMALYKKDYLVIPNEIKIWGGDTLQFTIGNPYLIHGISVNTKMRWTSRRLDTRAYRVLDAVYYKKHIKQLADAN